MHQSQEDTLVYFGELDITKNMVAECESQKISVFSRDEENWIDVEEKNIISSFLPETIKTGCIALRGDFHQENVLAAIAIAKCFNISNRTIESVLQSFMGLPMRCQLVSTKNGKYYYNDSFSTIPETTISALSTFTSPVAVVVGGSEKNSDFTEMAEYIATHTNILRIYVFGKTGSRIAERIEEACVKNKTEVEIVFLHTLEQIVSHFNNHSRKEDSLLLSPACASFDMFPNYKKRGELFDELVS